VDADGPGAHATAAAAAACIAGEEKRGVNCCCARFLGGIVRGRFGVGGMVELVSVAGGRSRTGDWRVWLCSVLLDLFPFFFLWEKNRNYCLEASFPLL
jgi:hypothetical protein